MQWNARVHCQSEIVDQQANLTPPGYTVLILLLTFKRKARRNDVLNLKYTFQKRKTWKTA